MNQNEIIDFLRKTINEKNCKNCSFNCLEYTKYVQAENWLKEMYE